MAFVDKQLSPAKQKAGKQTITLDELMDQYGPEIVMHTTPTHNHGFTVEEKQILRQGCLLLSMLFGKKRIFLISLDLFLKII